MVAIVCNVLYSSDFSCNESFNEECFMFETVLQFQIASFKIFLVPKSDVPISINQFEGISYL